MMRENPGAMKYLRPRFCWTEEDWADMNSPEEVVHESSGKPHEDHARLTRPIPTPPPPTAEQLLRIEMDRAGHKELMERVYAMRQPKDTNERFLMARKARIKELARERETGIPVRNQRQLAAWMDRDLPKRPPEDLLRLKTWKALPEAERIELEASWRFWWKTSGRPMSECPPFPS